MANTGVKYPATKTTQSVLPEDDDNWVNIANIGADDAVYASITAATYDANDISYRGKAQGFDFSAIPDGSTIDGILVEIERRCAAGSAVDYRVQLLDAAGALVGSDKADTVNAWPASDTVKSYGGATDTWTASPTAAMVKDADFGVVLSVKATGANTDIYVDFIRITVYYTAGAQTFYQSLPATAIGVVSISKLSSFYRTLGVTAIALPVMNKGMYLTLIATAVGQAVLTTAKMFSMALDAVAQGIATLTRITTYSKALNAVGVGVANLTRIATYTQILTATATGVSTLTRIATHYISLATSATGVPQLIKGMSKTLSATAVGISTLNGVLTIKRTLGATAQGIAGLATQFISGGAAYFGILKRWTGTIWAKAKLKIYTGSWVAKKLKRWNGTEWKEIDTTGV